MGKILIVDDAEEVTELLRILLHTAGYTAITAFDVPHGFDLAVSEKPDLIISDVVMPRFDGYELLDMLKSKRETADIPVIFLSARADYREIERGLKAGAVEYITKPYDSRKLLNLISKILEK